MMLTGIDGAAGGTTTITKDGGVPPLFTPLPSSLSFFSSFPPVDELCVLETSDCKSAKGRTKEKYLM
jgi:hypothetical protein